MRVLVGLVVLVVVVLFERAPAAAQDVSWGVKGGVNLATLSVSKLDPQPEFDYRIGLIAGGFFTWPLGSRLDNQPEALFSHQGATLE